MPGIELGRDEFSALTVQGGNQFDVIGSGSATVATAPLFEPNHEYKVAISGPVGSTTTSQKSDAAGRLTVQLQLGPGNRNQQYSPAAKASSLTPAKGELAAVSLPFDAGKGSQFFKASVRVLA
ncbi:hypothetical protein [Pseudofrankia sp. BMG5.36]|uniref:hypothetical protein n=1 Tax=Pseudofrankia sp. BMG5.36 TaxID=1834512 RepID=UPI001041C7FA|nr:hypothetical protein [Pseudofrankia sp. BMG5.36]